MPYITYRNSRDVDAWPEWFPNAVEPAHSVANITANDLVGLHNRLTQVDWHDIDAAVRLRTDGAPQQLVTSLLTEPINLTDEHVLGGRLRTAGEQSLHKFGLILGVIACNDYHRQGTDERLQADDPVAFERAHTKLRKHELKPKIGRQTLRTMFTEEPEGRWYMERYRELQLTNTDAFSTLYAMAHPHIEALMAVAPDDVWKVAAEVPESEAATAILTGMIDARRFFLNYCRYRAKRREFVNIYDVHSGGGAPVPLTDRTVVFRSGQSAEEMLKSINYGKPQWRWYDLRLGESAVRVLTQSAMVQTGPSSFQRGHFMNKLVAMPGYLGVVDRHDLWNQPQARLRAIRTQMEVHYPNDHSVLPSRDLSNDQHRIRKYWSDLRTFPRSIMMPVQIPDDLTAALHQ